MTVQKILFFLSLPFTLQANDLNDFKQFKAAIRAGDLTTVLTHANINARNKRGKTILHWAAKKSRDPEVIEKLLNNPMVDVNIMDNRGQTPLYLAVADLIFMMDHYHDTPVSLIRRQHLVVEAFLNNPRVQISESLRLVIERTLKRSENY